MDDEDRVGDGRAPTPDDQDIPRTPDRSATRVEPGTPRWVKVAALLGCLLAILVVIALLSGHGPSRHLGHAPAATRIVVVAALPGAVIDGRR